MADDHDILDDLNLELKELGKMLALRCICPFCARMFIIDIKEAAMLSCCPFCQQIMSCMEGSEMIQ